jgi:hypothetical protein
MFIISNPIYSDPIEQAVSQITMSRDQLLSSLPDSICVDGFEYYKFVVNDLRHQKWVVGYSYSDIDHAYLSEAHSELEEALKLVYVILQRNIWNKKQENSHKNFSKNY